jgi:hypothetical protein
MKRTLPVLAALLLGGLPLHGAPAKKSATTAVPADPGWPREIVRDGMRLVYHQPQVDEWKNYRSLRARVAFSLTPKEGKPVVGIAELEGNTVANLEARTVFIEKLKIASARFPSLAEADAAQYEAALKKAFPGKALTVSLDRLLSSVERGKEAFAPVEVKMDAPPIFTAASPAALLIVEGKPVQAPVEGTGLEFVVNTNWDVFFEPESKRYFLLSEKTWLTTDKLDGEWTLATKLPADFAKLPKDWEHVKKALPLKLAKGMKPPRVLFSDKPAELIEFSGGAPVFQKIPGTRLLWAKNTESWVFQSSEDSQIYFLVSGRWFRAPKLEGPWVYAGNDLPEDFKLIPPTHACADVLASVPGTPEAEDAVLLAQVPTEAVVKRAEAEAKAKVAYDGEPEFVAIEGTPMTYAKNTSSDVIKVEDKYYLCQDAVWFAGSAPVGPWKVVTVVPPVIYTIPPSYPLYRVVYVKVEDDNDPDVVVCSYTAGYYGAYVAGAAARAVLVWGTGWYYPPYVSWGPRPIYRPYYSTYGVSAAYNPWTGGYVVGQRAYGPYASAGRAAWYNPVTGGYGRAATVQGPYGGRTVAAGYNPRTDTGWTTRQGNNGYAQWGTSAVSRGDDWVRAGHVATDEGGVVRWQGSEGGGKIRVNDGDVSGVARHDDNLYAGKDGNVYRRDDDGNWAKYDDGDWENVDKPDRSNASKQSANEKRGEAQQKAQDRKPQNPPKGQAPGEAGERPRPGTGERPTTLPADRQRSQGGERPTTLPAERQRPQQSIEQRPSTRETQARPSADTLDSLKRESGARSRGNIEASRQQSVQRGGGSGNFSGGSRNMDAGSRGGGGGRSGGGGSRGGGGGGGGGRGRR